MQAVAVILALAVLAGCDARAVRPATAETWETSINSFFDKMVAVSQQTNEMLQNIQTSEFRSQLDKGMADAMTEVAKYKDSIEAKLRPLTETSLTQMAQDMHPLIQRLGRELQEGRDNSLVYLNDMKAEMMSSSTDTQERMQIYLKRLRKRIDADTAEIRDTVATYMSELQSRASQNLDAAREQVEPYLRDTMQTTDERMKQVSTALRTQAEGLGQQLESQAEVLRTQLEATGQEMRTFFEGMMDRLNEELPSIASQVREKLEDIVEKVKETASA